MLIVDTSVLYGARDRRDAAHGACAEALRREDRLIVVAPVVTETCRLLRTRLGARDEIDFVTAIVRGAFEVVELERPDYRRVAELAARYEDLVLGFVDAAIVAVAERLGLTRLATLNRRDFTVVRPSHTAHLTLVPEAALPS